VDWGTTPEYLNENWTEELLLLLTIKRAERIRQRAEDARPPKDKRMTDVELFNAMGVAPTFVTPRKKT
jgi:hypothetical protein